MCQANDPAELYKVIENNKVECVEFLPTILRKLIDYMDKNKLKFTALRILICGSDRWFISEYHRFKKFLPTGSRLLNSYGTSETAIDSSYFEFTSKNIFLEKETSQVP